MNVVIIGNGITGITAARNIRKHSNHRITVISSETEYFFSRTALMYVYMGHMKFEHIKPYEDWFWEKNNIQLTHDYVQKIDTENKKLILASGNVTEYDKLIIATGSKSNKFGWKGQDLGGVQGLYSKQDLDLLEDNTKGIKRGIIVGGGLIGIELAEMLLSREIEVTMLVRENSYWNVILPDEESAMINRHILAHGIDLRLSAELKEIVPGDDKRVKSVITSKNEEIECQLVGLTAGVSPNIDVAKVSGIECNRGIIVNQFLETNIKDVYSAGDCAEFKEAFPNRRNIEQVWYTGRRQAEALAKTICNERTAYNPGLWFNSAKFLDIEYQVYGLVNMNIQGEENFYFENTKNNVAVRIVHKDNAVIGFNLMGIRFRQDICHQWIEEKRPIEYVIENLGLANFDPEFYHHYEEDVVKKFNDEYPGKQVILKAKRGMQNIPIFTNRKEASHKLTI